VVVGVNVNVGNGGGVAVKTSNRGIDVGENSMTGGWAVVGISGISTGTGDMTSSLNVHAVRPASRIEIRNRYRMVSLLGI
jgi:hypothetical protein